MRYAEINSTSYTFALSIQNEAIRQGYTPPSDPDGQRHPANDVNAKCRVIYNDRAFCHTMGVRQRMAVDTEDQQFIEWCVREGLLPESYLHIKKITMYQYQLANAVVMKMVGADKYEEPYGVVTSYPITTEPVIIYRQPILTEHNFLTAKQRRMKESTGVKSLLRRKNNV